MSDDDVAESYLAVQRTLTQRSFEHYEVSNFAKGGHYAQHNLAIWRGADFLGLGAGACGTLPSPQPKNTARLRYRNTQSIEGYLNSSHQWRATALDEVGPLLSEHEMISPATLLGERLLLGLRLAEGVDVAEAAAELGVPPWSEQRQRAVNRWVERGKLQRVGTRLLIPPSEFLHADAVIRDLL